MNKLLSRIFAGLLVVLVTLALLCSLVFSIFNKVRYEHYWTDAVYPPLNFISKHPSILSSGHPFTLYRMEARLLELDGVERSRLAEGQALVRSQDGFIQSLIQIDSNAVLVFEFSEASNDVSLMYLWVIQRALSAVGESEFENGRAELAKFLASPIKRVTEFEQIASQLALESLASEGQYLASGVDGDYRLAYLRLKSGSILRVELPSAFSELTWPMFTLLSLLVLGVLGGCLFGLFWLVERRLRSIETVASRIARGELDARVKRADGADAISRLGGAFNSMADHIQRLMFVQKEMIHAVSHELRTPVARIRFGVQMIEDCPSQEALHKQVLGIDGDIQELDELIDEILTYARLEQGGPILAFQEADVKGIVEQVVSEQSSVKPDMDISATFKSGSTKWKESEIETRYIHRAIQNLVGNAVRYANGKVVVACAFDQDTCRVDVEDNGPGIPEDEWESVFTPFARLDDSRTRNTGGYGLGLSIVRRILYWHGGQAFLGRSDMGGAKFTLVWPRKQPVS